MPPKRRSTDATDEEEELSTVPTETYESDNDGADDDEEEEGADTVSGDGNDDEDDASARKRRRRRRLEAEDDTASGNSEQDSFYTSRRSSVSEVPTGRKDDVRSLFSQGDQGGRYHRRPVSDLVHRVVFPFQRPQSTLLCGAFLIAGLVTTVLIVSLFQLHEGRAAEMRIVQLTETGAKGTIALSRMALCDAAVSVVALSGGITTDIAESSRINASVFSNAPSDVSTPTAGTSGVLSAIKQFACAVTADWDAIASPVLRANADDESDDASAASPLLNAAGGRAAFEALQRRSLVAASEPAAFPPLVSRLTMALAHASLILQAMTGEAIDDIRATVPGSASLIPTSDEVFRPWLGKSTSSTTMPDRRSQLQTAISRAITAMSRTVSAMTLAPGFAEKLFLTEILMSNGTAGQNLPNDESSAIDGLVGAMRRHIGQECVDPLLSSHNAWMRVVRVRTDVAASRAAVQVERGARGELRITLGPSADATSHVEILLAMLSQGAEEVLEACAAFAGIRIIRRRRASDETTSTSALLYVTSSFEWVALRPSASTWLSTGRTAADAIQSVKDWLLDYSRRMAVSGMFQMAASTSVATSTATVAEATTSPSPSQAASETTVTATANPVLRLSSLDAAGLIKHAFVAASPTATFTVPDKLARQKRLWLRALQDQVAILEAASGLSSFPVATSSEELSASIKASLPGFSILDAWARNKTLAAAGGLLNGSSSAWTGSPLYLFANMSRTMAHASAFDDTVVLQSLPTVHDFLIQFLNGTLAYTRSNATQWRYGVPSSSPYGASTAFVSEGGLLHAGSAADVAVSTPPEPDASSVALWLSNVSSRIPTAGIVTRVVKNAASQLSGAVTQRRRDIVIAVGVSLWLLGLAVATHTVMGVAVRLKSSPLPYGTFVACVVLLVVLFLGGSTAANTLVGQRSATSATDASNEVRQEYVDQVWTQLVQRLDGAARELSATINALHGGTNLMTPNPSGGPLGVAPWWWLKGAPWARSPRDTQLPHLYAVSPKAATTMQSALRRSLVQMEAWPPGDTSAPNGYRGHWRQLVWAGDAALVLAAPTVPLALRTVPSLALSDDDTATVVRDAGPTSPSLAMPLWPWLAALFTQSDFTAGAVSAAAATAVAMSMLAARTHDIVVGVNPTTSAAGLLPEGSLFKANMTRQYTASMRRWRTESVLPDPTVVPTAVVAVEFPAGGAFWVDDDPILMSSESATVAVAIDSIAPPAVLTCRNVADLCPVATAPMKSPGTIGDLIGADATLQALVDQRSLAVLPSSALTLTSAAVFSNLRVNRTEREAAAFVGGGVTDASLLPLVWPHWRVVFPQLHLAALWREASMPDRGPFSTLATRSSSLAWLEAAKELATAQATLQQQTINDAEALRSRVENASDRSRRLGVWIQIGSTLLAQLGVYALWKALFGPALAAY